MALPTPGASKNRWGAQLNEFLRVGHNEDGTLKDVASETDVMALIADVDQVQITIAPLTTPGDPDESLSVDRLGAIRWGRNPWVNLANKLDGAASDHRAAFKSLLDTNGPGYTYFIPDGFTLKLPLSDYLSGNTPRLRNQTWIRGEGANSVLQVTGFATATSPSWTTLAGIELVHQNQTEDVEDAGIEDLTIQGDGPGASQTWTNAQASAIRLLTSTTHRTRRFTARRVVFRDIDGFPLHADGTPEQSMLVERCSFINCGNGLNVNGEFLTAIYNYFNNSEGIEASGSSNVYFANIFEDIFSVAISAGGNMSTGGNIKAFPGGQIINNRIFGVKGGGSYGVGNGIVTAQSTPDMLISGNYIERAYSAGIILSYDATTGPMDGHTVANNHIVSVGGTGVGTGIQIAGSNHRILGNRIYNRTALAGDPYPLGAHKIRNGISVTGDNIFIANNDIDMSNGGQYPIVPTGSPTNVRFGKNRLVAGTGYTQYHGSNAISCADASEMGDVFRDASAAFNMTRDDRNIWSIPTSAAKNVNLTSATGLKRKRVTITNRGNGTYAVTVTPSGTQTINGVNAALTLSTAWSSVTLVGDGTGWVIESTFGTVT